MKELYQEILLVIVIVPFTLFLYLFIADFVIPQINHSLGYEFLKI